MVGLSRLSDYTHHYYAFRLAFNDRVDMVRGSYLIIPVHCAKQGKLWWLQDSNL